MTNHFEERVLSVTHWTDRLFSFKTTRDRAMRFTNGQFVMVGLTIDDRPLLRAYSIASADYHDHLGFFSIKAPDGALTSRLMHLQPGDPVMVGRKATGTLVLDNLMPGGRNLYLLSTGTGIAPFAAIIHDPRAYELYDHVVLAHGCREVAELAYGQRLVEEARGDGLAAEEARARLLYFPSVTREPFATQGRVTDLFRTGCMASQLGLAAADARFDRVMICGSPDMVSDARTLLAVAGFEEGNHAMPGRFVLEKAFVDS
jgi:ferredoxin--NADP+ reductase